MVLRAMYPGEGIGKCHDIKITQHRRDQKWGKYHWKLVSFRSHWYPNTVSHRMVDTHISEPTPTW